MKVTFFENQLQFREWLENNHTTSTELIVGFYKIGSKKPSMTWSESVDQALCFGWIDGKRRSIDTESYCIRFTPRKPNSIWSVINIKKVDVLTNSGLMKPEGLEIFAKRKKENSNIYSHETTTVPLTADFIDLFQQNKLAWEFFNKQAPSYQRVSIHWIMSAKQEKTKLARLMKIIEASGVQKRLR